MKTQYQNSILDFIDNETLLSINDVSSLLNVSYSTLRRWDTEGKLRSVRIGNGFRKYKKGDINEILRKTDVIKQHKFTFIDLFAGIGGFHIAFSNLGGKCVASSENDNNCRTTYELNFYEDNREMFNNGYFFGDITKLKGNEFPDHDILCAGFPCQAFSIAGYRKGFEDERRGNLFFDLLRVINEKNPKVIFLENVKNLISHDNGKTFKIMCDALNDSGYYIKHKVLNSYEYGNVPQNRERIYIIGFKDKNHFENFEFPEKLILEKNIKTILEDNVENIYYYNGKPLFNKIKDYVISKNTAYQWRRQYVRENKKGLIPTLTANMGTGGHNVALILDDKGIRKLTPKECFRAQGFNDDFKLPKISNGQLYKQAGNSVTVTVLQRIGNNILKAININ